jgi:hypothetical protein
MGNDLVIEDRHIWRCWPAIAPRSSSSASNMDLPANLRQAALLTILPGFQTPARGELASIGHPRSLPEGLTLTPDIHRVDRWPAQQPVQQPGD